MEDSVAFRVRAKRGCATHPRSIAERVKINLISLLFSLCKFLVMKFLFLVMKRFYLPFQFIGKLQRYRTENCSVLVLAFILFIL